MAPRKTPPHPRARRTQPAAKKKESRADPHANIRIIVGVAVGALSTAMTTIATQVGGTFWADHAWVAWTLLALLIAALVINELPRLLSATYWLVVLTALGAALSVSLWVSVRGGPPVPLDGSEISAFFRDGRYDNSFDPEMNGVFTLNGHPVGESWVYFSPVHDVVVGEYMQLAATGLPDFTVVPSVTRSTDGKSMTAGPFTITSLTDLSKRDFTPTLAFNAAACYTVSVELENAGRMVAPHPISWCGPSAPHG